MADGFLGRWAKRKELVRKGEEVAPEPEKEVAARGPAPPPPPRKNASVFPAAPEATPSGGGSNAELPPALAEGGAELPPPLGKDRGGGSADQRPLPTREDVESLTPASDFSRYVRADVSPEVRNAALKKLFADPHFNVMDRLDTYIDDYSKPDPIPPGMLRQLASAKFLKLFDDEEKEKDEAGKAPTLREAADDRGPETVAQSSTAADPDQAVPPAEDHADPDLRLQQDHAPGPRGPGQGTG